MKKIGKKRKADVFKAFLETLHASEGEDLNDLELVKHLPKDMCYSFILRHPDNKICLDVVEPAIYLVAVYSIESQTTEPIAQVRLMNPRYYKKWPIFQYTPIRFPEEIDPNKSLNDIVCKEMSVHRSIKTAGYDNATEYGGNVSNPKYRIFEAV